MIKQLLLPVVLSLACGTATAQRWAIAPGEHRIVWTPDAASIPHSDHIEMSGEQMAFVLRWGIRDDGSFREERSLVFPMLRTVPNNTHASLMYRMATDIPSMLGVNGMVLQEECVDSLSIDGALTVRSRWAVGLMNIGAARDRRPTPCIEMTRRIFPSQSLPLMCERYTLRNIGSSTLCVSVPEFSQVVTTDPAKGVDGAYIIRCDLAGAGTRNLVPADSLCFDVVFQAYRSGEEPQHPDVAAEYADRMDFVRNIIDANLILETPDEVLDTEFRYAKLRASESIFKTRGGYMHAPGGESYYAAIWCNDQAEYVNPFFPFLGYDIGNASAINTYRHFARFMNDEYKPIPSSIIAEGLDSFGVAGDRGDAAMVGLRRGPLRPGAWRCVRSPGAVAADRVVPGVLPAPADARGCRGFGLRRARRSLPVGQCQPLHLDALLRRAAFGRAAGPRSRHRSPRARAAIRVRPTPWRGPSTATSPPMSAATRPIATTMAIRCSARGSACR